MKLYHIDRVLLSHGWTCTSDKPRLYEKSGTTIRCNRSGVVDVTAPSGPLQPFIPAVYFPFAVAGLMFQQI